MQLHARFAWVVATLLGTASCQLVSGLDELKVEKAAPDDSTDDPTDTDEDTEEPGEVDSGSPTGCTIPTGLECSPADNCGCDADEVCGLEANAGDISVACQPPGEKELGETCNLNECAEGFLCVDHVCMQTCRFNPDCEADEAECTEVLRPNGKPLNGVRYCLANCDLVSPRDPEGGLAACADTQTCAATAQGAVCTSTVGSGAAGETCDEPSDCAAGLTCDAGQCKRWCRVDESTCDAGSTCEPWAMGNTATEGLGVCSTGCEATIPEGDECLTNPNCGCSAGQTCRVMGDGSRACSPSGDGEAQAACDNNSNCGDGLACMAGLCRPYCDPEAPECSDESLCIEVQYDGELVGVGACLGLCDPVHPDTDDEVFTPCGEGAECAAGDLNYYYPTAHCMPAAAQPGPLLGSCDLDNPCAAGATCIFGRCFPYCRSPDDCTGATEYAVCFDVDFGFRGSEDDVLGLCCPSTPVEGSTCAFDLDCGCDDGFSCRVGDSSTGATACTPVGEAGYQQGCVYDTECAAGLSCVGGLCSPHCIGPDEPCDVNEGECIQVYTSDDDPQPVPYAYVCAGRCDPVDLTRADDEVKPCGAGADCVAGWTDGSDSLSSASFCAPDSGDAVAGEACATDTECDLGLGCDFIDCPLGEDCLGVCAAYCESTEDCDPGLSCDIGAGRVGAPGTYVGYCRLLVTEPQDDAG